jgi:hypothetical protein
MWVMYASLMDQALRALREHRNEDAQALLINVIVSEPEDDEAWLLLAEAMADANKKRECLERARAINPGNPAILRALERLSASPIAGATDTEESPVETAPAETANADSQSSGATDSIAPLLEHGESIAQTVLMTTEAPDTRHAGRELVQLLCEAAARDAVTTRRWARSAGRGALIKYEKALTTFIANLPRDDPQLPRLREQRQLVLDHLR